VVLFEEMLPQDAWNRSVEAAEQCDLMLVFGSSLVVYPAAEIPMIAVSCGAPLVIVNMEPTDYDRRATVVVNGKLGEFAKATLDALKKSNA
jgi:NAD-dependent deacetylase